MSQSAKRITDFSAITGGWKAMIISDPLELRNSYTTDYMNIKIDGSASSAKVTFRWHSRFMNSSGKSVDVSKDPPGSFKGSFSNGKLSAIGSGKIEIKSFFYDKGKEYALGTYTWPDGVIGYIGMVRP